MNKRIGQLDETAELLATDVLPIEHNGVTKKITVQNLLTPVPIVINRYAAIKAADLDNGDVIVKRTVNGKPVFTGEAPNEFRATIEVQETEAGSDTKRNPTWDNRTKRIIFKTEAELNLQVSAFMNLLLGNTVSANNLPDIDCNKLMFNINME